MRVLIFCPTAPRLEPEVVNSIFSQQGVEFFDVIFTRDNPLAESWTDYYKNIQINYEKMKRMALAEGYQKIWIVESDTIPPKDALRKLLEVPAPVVSGLYGLRHGEPVPNLMRGGNEMRMPDVGSALKWQEIYSQKENVIQVSGGCMGCLLIETEILRDFSFMMEYRGAPDVPLMQYLWRSKIQQMARLDVQCGHKKPNGEIIWPDRNNTQGYRIERAN